MKSGWQKGSHVKLVLDNQSTPLAKVVRHEPRGTIMTCLNSSSS